MKHLDFPSLMALFLGLVTITAVSCMTVHYTTTKTPAPGTSFTVKKYAVKKAERTGPGTICRLQGLTGRWYFDTDTLKKGDSVVINLIRK